MGALPSDQHLGSLCGDVSWLMLSRLASSDSPLIERYKTCEDADAITLMQEAIQGEIQSEVDERRAAQQAQRAMEDEGGVLLDNPNHTKEAWRPLRRSRKGKLAEPNGNGDEGESHGDGALEDDGAELDGEQDGHEEEDDDSEGSEDGEEEDDEDDDDEGLASDEEWVTETDKLGNTTRRKVKLAGEDVEEESVDTLAEGAERIVI